MRASSIIYHDVVDEDWDASGFPGTAAALYKFHRDEFDRQLIAIAASSRYRAVRVDAFF